MDTTRIATRSLKLLGQDLSGITSVTDALHAAGLDWGVNAIPATNLAVLTDDGVISTQIPGQYLVMRDDTHVTLGVVGGRYRTVDNADAFALGDEVIRLGGQLTCGGPLDGGRRAFLRFELPEAQVAVGGKDLVSFGFDLTTSHDGNGNVAATIWATRLVCTNGMTATIKDTPNSVAIRHTGDPVYRISQAGAIVRQAAAYAKSFAATAEEMISTRFTPAQFTQYIDTLYPRPVEPAGRRVTVWENRRHELMSLYRLAGTNEEGRNTAWSAYNALTEYLDWTAPVRSHTGTTEQTTRARRQFDGATQPVKDRAFQLLTA